MSSSPSHPVGRLAFGALCLMFIVLMCGACLVAYQDLTGPHCDGHAMGPADTCSVLTSRGYRSVRTIEKLNPTGTPPAVLTPPVLACDTEEYPHRGVLAGGHAGCSPHLWLRHGGIRVADVSDIGRMGLQGLAGPSAPSR